LTCLHSTFLLRGKLAGTSADETIEMLRGERLEGESVR